MKKLSMKIIPGIKVKILDRRTLINVGYEDNNNEILKKVERKTYYIVRYSIDKKKLIEMATPTGTILSLIYLSEISFYLTC